MDISCQQRIQYKQEMLVLRFELKVTLSRERWSKVFSKEKPAK
jgi:hypothetical protein